MRVQKAVTLRGKRWDTHAPLAKHSAFSTPSFGMGKPNRTPGKKDKPLQFAGLGNPAEAKKARSVVALSCVTRFGRGRRFASGY
jgi:hypothetical protein